LTEEIPKPKPKPRPAERRGAVGSVGATPATQRPLHPDCACTAILGSTSPNSWQRGRNVFQLLSSWLSGWLAIGLAGYRVGWLSGWLAIGLMHCLDAKPRGRNSWKQLMEATHGSNSWKQLMECLQSISCGPAALDEDDIPTSWR